MQAYKLKVLAVAAAIAMGVPMAAQAESTLTTGTTTPLTAAARLDFKVVINKFVYLRIGAGSDYATSGPVNELVFTPAFADIGNSTPVTGTGGDVTASTVTVQVRGNNGPISLAATGPAALSNGTDTIAWTQITATPTGTAPSLPPVNGAAVTVGAGKVVAAVGTWPFQYANGVTPASGDYVGRVTYTASMP